MNTLLKVGFVVSVAVALTACGTTALMDGIMSSWRGASLSDVVQQWGLPSQEMKISGQRYYVWNYQKTAFIPQTSTTTGAITNSGVINTQTMTSGGFALSGNCERVLQVDQNDVVIGGSWRGNNCPFMEAFEYKDWRRRVSAAP